MNSLKLIMLSGVAGCCMLAIVPMAMAQAAQVPLTQERPALPQGQLSLDTGMAPDCPYGYYEAAPNACAPYGYYGPEWFTGGAFIGAGSWFHGPTDFHGQVDSRLNVENGYKGKLPERGDKADRSYHLDKNTGFKGNETRDGRGHKSPDLTNGYKKYNICSVGGGLRCLNRDARGPPI